MAYNLVDLSRHYSGSAFTARQAMDQGDFTGIGSTYPAEDLPKSNEVVKVKGVPFQFPNKERESNLELDNQTIFVPKNTYRCIHILGAADNGSFLEKIVLTDGIREESYRLGLTNWIATKPEYGEEMAFQCNGMHSAAHGFISGPKPIIWYQRIHIEKTLKWDRLVFGDNPCVHIFAMTLEV